ncbi:unnamed protein product [Lampetra fluviatilis]
MPSLKENLIIIVVIFALLTSCYKLFKTSTIKNVLPKLHYQNKKLQFLPNKDEINSSTTTNIPITTKRPILISTNITCSTSFKNSRITILNGGEPHTVGDTLNVEVEMYDFTNRRKLYGGDFLLARIFSPSLGAASSGVVTDLGNGVYNVRFTLFWPGDSSLAFTLVHSSEAVSVLDRVRETIPDKVTFLGTFVSGKSREVTSCHTFLNTTKQVCDYTDTHLNEPWKCEKPSELPCSALLTIKSYNKYRNVFSEEESKFFTSDRIWVSKQLTYNVRVAPANGSFESNFEDCAMGFGNPNPSGYYLRNTWQSTYCKTKQFNSPLSVLNCLKGKNVILLGDSTIRQWWEYLVSFIKDLHVIDLHKPGKHQPKKAVNESYDVTWQWFCHSYPFIASADTYPEDLKYVANRIDNITGKMNSKTFRSQITVSNTIVFITLLAAVLLIYCSNGYFKNTWNLESLPPKVHYQNALLLQTNDTISGTMTYPSTKHKIPISTNITCSTSAKNSRITILNGEEPPIVGGTLHVQVAMYDFGNRRKLYGGDFLLARIFSPRLGAASSGVVTDLGNGVYDVRFTLFWPGESSLAFTLVHSSEAVSVLDRVRETIPDKVTFLGTFVSGKSKEVTPCHIFPNTAEQVCDFTDPHLREPWMCEKPSTLPCSSLLTIKSRNRNIFSQEEGRFFTREKIWKPIPSAYKIDVAPVTDLLESSLPNCIMGMGNPSPSGYYINNAWCSSYCKMNYFSSPSLVLGCLKGKNIFLLGDSTIGQWFKYLVHFTNGFRLVDRYIPGKHMPNVAINEDNSITLNWYCHNYPFIATKGTYTKDFRYIANRIDNITGGSDTVVAISLGAHFTPFPLHVFQTRMHNIKAAVEKLLIRSPETKVIVKLSNVRENSGVAIFNNWNTFKLNQVLLELFKTMNVAFIDAWDMTAVLNSAKIHPNEHIVKNQIDSFLSFVC